MAEDEESRGGVGGSHAARIAARALVSGSIVQLEPGKGQGSLQPRPLAKGASLYQGPSNSDPEAFLLGGQAGASSSPAGWGRLRPASSSCVQGARHVSDETRGWRRGFCDCNSPMPRSDVAPKARVQWYALSQAVKRPKSSSDFPFLQEALRDFLQTGCRHLP